MLPSRIFWYFDSLLLKLTNTQNINSTVGIRSISREEHTLTKHRQIPKENQSASFVYHLQECANDRSNSSCVVGC